MRVKRESKLQIVPAGRFEVEPETPPVVEEQPQPDERSQASYFADRDGKPAPGDISTTLQDQIREEGFKGQVDWDKHQ